MVSKLYSHKDRARNCQFFMLYVSALLRLDSQFNAQNKLRNMNFCAFIFKIIMCWIYSYNLLLLNCKVKSNRRLSFSCQNSVLHDRCSKNTFRFFICKVTQSFIKAILFGNNILCVHVKS